ncbi:MAG: glutamine--fructose-6-phosphate transaminase (isomerizing) [Clostridiales bacterium]|nr:glutamine--fructose-6-phosphate transaminase (isomerizing) [Clostridiales bacterium]
MCGIVGFTGSSAAAPILLDGLSKLEYRGYDSAGIAVEHQGKIEVVKAKGRLKILSEMTNNGLAVPGSCGIGHTRWATHGDPSTVNAHPQCSADRKITIVHNGIIENYQEIKDFLTKHGYRFVSSTDTEVVANLLDYYYKGGNSGFGSGTGNMLRSISKAMRRMRGSYALGILVQDEPGTIYAVRKDSPLIVSVAEDGTYIASDVPAILKYSRNVYYPDNQEIVRLTPAGAEFYDIDGERVEKPLSVVEWDTEAAEKGGYEHFMMKEIHEQPKAVQDAISARIDEAGNIDLEELHLDEEQIRQLERLYIVACGSAYHVAVAAKYVIEELTNISVETDLASEFRYRKPKLAKNAMVIVISQSGETADTLAAMREAQNLGCKVLAIVNVVGSSIAREADHVMYTWAGPEISVATTKAYSAQLACIYLLATQFGKLQGTIDEEKYHYLIGEMEKLPNDISRILEDKERLQWFASKYASAQDIFFIGRGIDYAVSLEGSLKLKEVSYIHSEAYAAGELKHGAISLVENNMLVISVLTQPELYEKMVSNMVEVKSRGAYVMGLTNYGNYAVEDTADFTVYVPKREPLFMPSLAIIPLQLLAYYVSCAKGLDVDKPRNLAKSVTVE